MDDHALIAAVDTAIAETGVKRYRWLALEQPDESQRRIWQNWIMAGRPAQVLAPQPPRVAVDYGTATAETKPCGGCP